MILMPPPEGFGMPADGAIPLPVQPVGIMPDSPWLTAVGGGIY